MNPNDTTKTLGDEHVRQRHQSWLDIAIILYLALPVAAFVAASFRLPAAALLLASVALSAYPLCRARLPAIGWSRSSSIWCTVALVVALVWTYLSGAGNLVFANSDWIKHDAVFTDLARYAWPVTYFQEGGASVVLRYYEGYYVVPALLTKWLGHQDTWVFLWTALGIFLVIARTGLRVRSWTRRLIVTGALVIFGGLDLIGWLTENDMSQLQPGTHIEHWGIAAFNNATTLVSWVPQHAISAWLATLLVLTADDDDLLGGLVESAPFLVAVTMFWSIFAAIGVVPFLVLPLLRRLKATGVSLLWHPAIWAGLIVFTTLAAFLVTGSGDTPSSWIWDAYPLGEVVRELGVFLLLEVAILVVALRIAGRYLQARTWIAVAALCAVSTYMLGAYSDFTMRASIPALFVLFWAVRKTFDEMPTTLASFVRVVPLFGVLGLAAVTAQQEISRALERPPGPFDDSLPSEVLMVAGYPPQMPSQYLAAIDGPLADILRTRSPELAAERIDPQWKASCCTSRQAWARISSPNEITFTVKDGNEATFLDATELMHGTYRIRADVRTTKPLPRSSLKLGFDGEDHVLPFQGDSADDLSSSQRIDQFVSVFDGVPRHLRLRVEGVPEGGVDVVFANLHFERLDARGL